MLWKLTQNFLTTIVVFYTGIHWGLASIPGTYLVLTTIEKTFDNSNFERALFIGISVGLAYVLWMLSTIIITSILSFIFKDQFSFLWNYINIDYIPNFHFFPSIQSTIFIKMSKDTSIKTVNIKSSHNHISFFEFKFEFLFCNILFNTNSKA